MKDIPFMEGEGIYLRELRETDLEGDWYAWFNDSEVTKYQNKKIFPNTREKQKAYYHSIQNSSQDVVFAIVETASALHIGNVGLHHIDWVHRSAELGIVIGEKKFWGKSYGKQAWRMITRYGFYVLNLHRISAVVMEKNTASQQCAEAAGFTRDGRVRDMFFKNGAYENAFYYNILRQDFKP